MRQRPLVRTLLILMLVLIGVQISGRPQGAVGGAAPVTMTLPLLHRFAVGLPTDDVAVLPLSRTVLRLWPTFRAAWWPVLRAVDQRRGGSQDGCLAVRWPARNNDESCPWHTRGNRSTECGPEPVLLAQEAGKRALVLDEGTGHVFAALALPTGARHVAADPALGQIYLPDEFSGQLVVARLMAGWGHLLTTMVTVGRQPHGVAVDPRTHRVYVGNERGATVTVVDDLRLRVQATVPAGRTPGGVAVAPLSGLVSVVLVGENRVAILDARLGRVVRAVGVGTAPDPPGPRSRHGARRRGQHRLRRPLAGRRPARHGVGASPGGQRALERGRGRSTRSHLRGQCAPVDPDHRRQPEGERARDGAAGYGGRRLGRRLWAPADRRRRQPPQCGGVLLPGAPRGAAATRSPRRRSRDDRTAGSNRSGTGSHVDGTGAWTRLLHAANWRPQRPASHWPALREAGPRSSGRAVD